MKTAERTPSVERFSPQVEGGGSEAVRDSEKRSNYFGQGYYHVYRDFLLPPEMTRAETEFLISLLRPQPGERWLDMPCGYGRHLKALAESRLGLNLIGGDLSREYLREAGLNQIASVAACDMRRLPFADGSFHTVLNMLNSFGYHPPERTEPPRGKWMNLILGRFAAVGQQAQRDRRSPGGADETVRAPSDPLWDDRVAAAEFARVLKPGGRLVLDLSNRRLLIALARQPFVRYAEGDYESLEQFAWDPVNEVLNIETTWRWPGGCEHAPRHRMRLYTPQQISKMLALGGLQVDKIFGGFDGRPFNARRSDRMLVIARK